MSFRSYLLSSLLLSVILVFIGSSLAQEDACPEIVETALISLSDVCSDMGRNTVCYGNNQVQASFFIDVPANFFAQPADRADVLDLETIQTASLNIEQNIWGVAVMNIQADLPNTLPGQSVTILLLGNAELQNDVAPDRAFVAGDPITITTAAPATNIRNAPTINSLVLGSVERDTSFETDAVSADGEWTRIIFENQPAWISTSLINAVDLSALPAIQSNQYTSMQAFSFSTGIGQPVCNQAPDSILIQGPEDIEVTINANGLDITIGSTIVLSTPSENSMQVVTASGAAIVDGVTVPAGFTVSTDIDNDGNVVSGTLSGFRPLSSDELNNLRVIEQINPELLQYRVELPTLGEIFRLQTAIQNREQVIAACQSANLTAQQCQTILGSDENLQNRLDRCLNFGFSGDTCRAIIGGNLSASTVINCLNNGFTSAETCRESVQQDEADLFTSFCEANGASTADECQSLCESQGYSTQDECQAAVIESIQNSEVPQFCQALGYTSVSECQTECEARGYTTLNACRDAFISTQQGQTNSGSSSSPQVTSIPQQTTADFCQSIGASNQQECAQICQSNGYSNLADCQAGMGG